jgi:pSer/pThr/pTyr-binding forkhead associated (FHA) protein
MEVWLEMETDGGPQRSFELSPGVTVIGRARRSDIRISLPGVEPRHCELVLEDGRLRIRDLGSSIGIYRNGRRVGESNLAHGDRLSIGQVVFRVCLRSPTAPAGGTLTEIKPARSSQPPPSSDTTRDAGETTRRRES